MGVPTSEVSYTSATTGRGDHEVHKGHVVALEKKKQAPPLAHKSVEMYPPYVHNPLRFGT
jgi:hypothetical protein